MLTALELSELREEVRKKYDHPDGGKPMIMNPRGVLALLERGDEAIEEHLHTIEVLKDQLERETTLERLLKRAAEALHCGCRGIQHGRNSWELLTEIEFYLGAREEDRRSVSDRPRAAPPAAESPEK